MVNVVVKGPWPVALTGNITVPFTGVLGADTAREGGEEMGAIVLSSTSPTNLSKGVTPAYKVLWTTTV
jgi:hypothetical protein